MRLARVGLRDGSVELATVEEAGVRVVGGGAGIARLTEVLLDPRSARPGELLPLADVTLLAPIGRPPSVRDFMVFEEHVANARQRTGRDVPPAWYTAPAFYFTNPAAVVGPDDEVAVPRGCRALDLELEVACIVGREVADLDPDDPACLDAIAGFVLMNDWSARDLQVREMPVGLGPVKGKDFATSLGPWVVTKDELTEVAPGRWSCDVEAAVNGRRIGGADIATAAFGWTEIVARASENTRLVPGDVLGSGTVGTGCVLELRELGHRDDNPWLRAGDVVELHGGPLGTLRNRVVANRRTTE
ncbi:fumarylacetoacetate hydrolase family protein [Dactylosporangium salmoneum]|uniref:Fumarylacetoacetate hydrolase family protein n=1 Tax=Dactylosporangium salmoneum TaxID=53361 RepID=A0ABP5SYA9_9ACTN